MRISRACLLIVITALSVLSTSLCAQTGKVSQPPRLKRADSFLGVHFDFHAGNDCTEIGKNVDRAMVEYIIDTVRPDYVQTDCKGHPGLSSYPTRAGNPAPGFVKDTLKIWREVTAERGVSLYMHYSGVMDIEAVRKHPEWARVTPEGKPDERLTSVFGPYVDELLIPQLTELSDVYGVDGVWIDGECWAVAPDYRPDATAAFTKETGIAAAPKKQGEPGWFEWLQFNRRGFLAYVEHYTTAMHMHNPAFQVCSNWAFSSTMPLPVSINLDFISGDYKPLDSVRAARFEGRCMVHQGKPWDLMAWHFTNTGLAGSTKTVPQLCQEAAAVLALGGGFQAYFPQKRDGSIRKWQMALMGETAEFCRARQEYCHKAEPIPQIGLIYSGEAFFRNTDTLFGSWGAPAHQALEGILNALCDGQQVVDIVMEHHLAGRMSDYPVLIWPEWNFISPAFRKELLDYVVGGGRLLVIGPEAAALFAKELGVALTGASEEKVNGLAAAGWLADVRSSIVNIAPYSGTRIAGYVYENNDFAEKSLPAATIRSYGKGMIAGVYLGLGESYLTGEQTVVRDFLSGLIRELFPLPLVEVTGSHHVDVTAMRKNGKLMINMVNMNGGHTASGVYVYDDIAPAGPLAVTVRTGKEPSRITLQPGNRPVRWRFLNGEVTAALDGIAIHDILMVE